MPRQLHISVLEGVEFELLFIQSLFNNFVLAPLLNELLADELQLLSLEFLEQLRAGDRNGHVELIICNDWNLIGDGNIGSNKGGGHIPLLFGLVKSGTRLDFLQTMIFFLGNRLNLIALLLILAYIGQLSLGVIITKGNIGAIN